MSGWRDELIEAIKSKAEREAEEEARHKQRLLAALEVADAALAKAEEGLRFADEHLRAKQQPVKLHKANGEIALEMHDQRLAVLLSRDDAVLRVSFNDGRPREFDFAKDRHLSPKDVEEYVGRRAVELARAAQKIHPW
jgi:hypothetical protein